MFGKFLNILDASSGSGSMFKRGWMDFGGAMYDLFVKIIWTMICGLMQVIYSVEQAFYWLAGIDKGISYTEEGGKVAKTLDSLFPTIDINSGNVSYGTLFGDSRLLDITKIMLAVGIGMVVFFLAFAVIKGLFNNEGKSDVMIKSSLVNTGKACVFMALAPMMIMITLSTIMFFLNIIFTSVFNVVTGGSSQSIAESIFSVCYTGKLTAMQGDGFIKAITSSGGSWGVGCETSSPQLFIQFYDLETLIKGGTLNGVNMQLEGDFNYFVAFVGGCFTLVSLGLMCIRIGERLFNLIIDYILSIPAIATMPYDGGQRFSTWGQLFLGQVLNFSGSVLAMAVYLFVVSNITSTINGITATNSQLFKATVNLIIIIGGAFTCVKAGTVVSQLIGQVASNSENQSLNQSMQLARMGASATKTAGAVALGAFGVGAMSSAKAFKQQNGGNNNQKGGGTGGSNPTGGAGATNAVNNLAGKGEAGDISSTSKATAGESGGSNPTGGAGESSPLGASTMSVGGSDTSKANVNSTDVQATSSKESKAKSFFNTLGTANKSFGAGVFNGMKESARVSRGNPLAMVAGGLIGGAGAVATGLFRGAGAVSRKVGKAIGNTNTAQRHKFNKSVRNTENALKKKDLSTNKGIYKERANALKQEYAKNLKDIKKNKWKNGKDTTKQLKGEEKERYKFQKGIEKGKYEDVKGDIKEEYNNRKKRDTSNINWLGGENHNNKVVDKKNLEKDEKDYYNKEHLGLDVKSMAEYSRNKTNNSSGVTESAKEYSKNSLEESYKKNAENYRKKHHHGSMKGY